MSSFDLRLRPITLITTHNRTIIVMGLKKVVVLNHLQYSSMVNYD